MAKKWSYKNGKFLTTFLMKMSANEDFAKNISYIQYYNRRPSNYREQCHIFEKIQMSLRSFLSSVAEPEPQLPLLGWSRSRFCCWSEPRAGASILYTRFNHFVLYCTYVIKIDLLEIYVFRSILLYEALERVTK